MFEFSDVAAFILRLAIFLLIFSNYPVLHYCLIDTQEKLFFGEKYLSKFGIYVMGWSVIVIDLLFALFYPNVGTVLSYVGAICGFVIIYLMPITVLIA